MGMFIFWLIPAVGVALLLRALIRSFTESWRPVGVLSCRNILLAVLRAFPFVFAFTPYLLTKRGLGVLIPAALYLCGATYERLFGHRAPDAEDNRNFAQGVSIFFLAWGVLALIFFAQQSLAIDRKTEDKGRA